jgi:tetratricopeptide (TPR) repeat protein/tRNA A-37 threonylcarbamoyl transferase component Bud32
MQVSCPHCRNLLQIADPPINETVCTACGTTIPIGAMSTFDWSPSPRTTENAADEAEQIASYRLGTEPTRMGDDTVSLHGATPSVSERHVPALGDAAKPIEETGAKSAQPRNFGGYELLDEVARGGMGVVYKARQRGLNRIVALKMIIGGKLASDADVRRFRTEAQAAANLHHPHIVAIHDVGVHETLHYFSMDFVQGTSLTALVRNEPLPAQRAARYVQRIAEAIHYAHGQGILHRDIKPSNVLLDNNDQPRITDFGLAKQLENESGLTASGAILGTPSYMPPEQAEGRNERVGPASDIYSIGAMLYELVTGQPPFRGESPVETLHRVLNSEPARPSLLNPSVDRDVETICLKCLQKDPGRRYASGQALADDLGRYLRGEPILARPVGNVERAWRWCRRNSRVATLAAFVFLLLGMVAAGSLGGYLKIRNEQASTEFQRVRAEKNSKLARGAVQDMLTRVADELLPDLPQNAQTENTRLTLLNGALSYYQQFLEDNAEDPTMRREIASTLQRVGEISHLLGDDVHAEQAFHKAIAMFQDLTQRFPDSRDYLQGLAAVYNFLGELHRTRDQTELAEKAYRQAIDLQQRLVAGSGDNVAYHTEFARCRSDLGILLKDCGRPDESEAEYDAAISTLTPWLDRTPLDRDVLQGLARANINRGVLMRSTDRLDEAEQSFARGLELMNQLVQSFPSRAQYQLELAACHNNLGNLLLNAPCRRAAAADNYRKALNVFAKLSEISPGVPSYRRELANCCNNLATVLKIRAGTADAEGGDGEEALSTWQRGRDLASKLLAERPDRADYHWLFGAIVGNLGGAALDQNDLLIARSMLEQATEHEQTALDSNPSNPTYRAFLRTDSSRLARTLIRGGQHGKAVEAARRLPDLFPDTWQEYHRAAKFLAQCVPLAENDESASADERKRRSESYAAESMRLLQGAVERGYRNLEELKTDAAFLPLHANEIYTRVVAELESTR